MKLWLLHPMAVHFPIVLLSLGFAVFLRALAKGEGDWAASAARGLLWLGASSAWAALGLGLLAEKTAPHVPAAWQVLEHHEELAWWTCGNFTAASALAYWLLRRGEAAPRRGQALLLALWLAGLGLLFETAEHGGELVYEHNVGTAASHQ